MEDAGTISAAAVAPVCNEPKKKRTRGRKKTKVVITDFENQHAQEGWSDASKVLEHRHTRGAAHGLSGADGAKKDTDGDFDTQGHTMLEDTCQSSLNVLAHGTGLTHAGAGARRLAEGGTDIRIDGMDTTSQVGPSWDEERGMTSGKWRGWPRNTMQEARVDASVCYCRRNNWKGQRVILRVVLEGCQRA